MKNAVLALFLVPLLTMPAFADSLSDGDKPMVVAEGADVRIGSVGVDNVGRYNGLSLPPGIPAPGPRVPPAPSPSAEPLSPGRRLSPRFIPPPSSGASKTSSRDRGVSARDVNLAALRRGTSRGTGRRLSPRPPRREGPRNILTEIGECRGGACTTPAGALAPRACAWRSVFVSR
jgi:hypothetical protein